MPPNNPNFISTLATSITGDDTTNDNDRLKDGTDTLNANLINALNIATSGSFVASGGNITMTAPGGAANTVFAIEEIKYFRDGKYLTMSALSAANPSVNTNMPDWDVNTNFDWFGLIVIADGSESGEGGSDVIKFRGSSALGATFVDGATPKNGDIPLAAVQISKSSTNTTTTRKVQYLGMGKVNSEFTAVDNGNIRLTVNKGGTLTYRPSSTNYTLTLPSVTGTLVSTGDTGSITAAMLGANSVDSSELVDGSIDTSHIADDQVTYAKIQNVSATNRILGRDSSGAGIIEEITPANLRTMINVEDGSQATSTAHVKSALNADLGGSMTIGDANDTVTVAGDLVVTGTTTTESVETVSTSNGVVFEGSAADAYEITLKAGTVSADRTITLPNVTGTVALTSSDITGNSATATALETARTINGVSFDGTSNITVTAAAGTLTGNTLKSTVTGSSLTSVGTIGTGTWQGTAIADSYISSASTWNAKLPTIDSHDAETTIDIANDKLLMHDNSATGTKEHKISIADMLGKITSSQLAGSGKVWATLPASGAEVNQNTFTTVAVSGQTDVVAETKTDTLTFAEGGATTITTAAGSDTITISSLNTTYSAGNGIALSGGAFSVAAGNGLSQDASGLSLVDPATLNELTESTDDGSDKILLWDEDASLWKYMTITNLEDSVGTYTAGTGLSISSNEFSHDAHTGEVTGSDALTVANNVIDEANLKISNSGSNGQFLSKQSGNTGGLTWATPTDTDTTYTATSGKGLTLNGTAFSIAIGAITDIGGAIASDDVFALNDTSASGAIRKSDVSRLQTYMQNNLTFTTNTNTQLSNEQVQDIVGAMFTGNTETNITVTYQDDDGTIDLVASSGDIVDDTSPQLGGDLDVNGNKIITDSLNESIQIQPHGLGAVEIINTDATDARGPTLRLIRDSSSPAADDRLGYIEFKGEDSNGDSHRYSTITSTLIDPTAGSLDGKLEFATMINNGPEPLMWLDSAGVSVGRGLGLRLINSSDNYVNIKPASSISSNFTLTLPGDDGSANQVLKTDGSGTLSWVNQTTNTNTQLSQENVEDYVGGMLDGTETFISVSYDDTDGNIDFVVPVKDEDNMASDSASPLATQQSIKAYVDAQTSATTVTVTDSSANTNFPVVFHNESNGLLDDTGALRYNPSTGTLLVPNLTVAGTTTQVDTVTMNAANALIFEGATADDYETTLTITDPTADRTITLPNASGTVSLSDTTYSAGTGLDLSSTTFSVDVSDFMTNGANNRIITATGSDAMNAEASLTFDGTDLKLAMATDPSISVQDTTDNYAATLFAKSSGAWLSLGDVDSSADSWMKFGAFSGTNNLDTKTRDFHLYGTNTATGFYFDESAGTFGIGTTSPASLLHLHKNAYDYDDGTQDEDGDFHLLLKSSQSSNAGDALSIGFGQSGNAATVGAKISHVIEGSYSRGALTFSTNNTAADGDTTEERMRITGAGKVGIGTTSAMNKLQVDHTGADGDDGIMIVRADTSTASNDMLGGIGFDSTDGNVPSSVLEASVAIIGRAREDHGTGDKGGYLDFYYSPTDQDDDTTSRRGMRMMQGKLSLGGQNDDVGDPINSLVVEHSGADWHNGVLILRDDSSIASGDLLGAIGFDGKDGNNPSSVLEASAGIAAYAAENHGTGDKGGDLVFFTTAIDDDDDTSSHERVRLTSEGKLGIGTNDPDKELHVEGSVLIDTYNTDGAGGGLFFREGHLNTNQPSITLVDHSGANPDGLAISAYDGISWNLDATEKMRLTSTGLGIGTTSPSTALDVAGDISADRLNLEKSSGYASIELGGSSGAFIDMKNPFSDDFDCRIITDGTGLDIIAAGSGNHITLKTNGTERFQVEDAAVTFFNAYAFPNADGSANQVLKTDGSGSVTWADQSGSGAVSAVANGSNNRIATFSSADALNGEANLQFDGSELDLVGRLHIDRNVDSATDATASAAIFIDYDSSGTNTPGQDNEHYAIYIDQDNSSTAGGSGSDEIEMAGVYVDQRQSGDANKQYALQTYQEFEPSTAQTIHSYGGTFHSIHSVMEHASATVTSLWGNKTDIRLSKNGVNTNTYGEYNYIEINNNRESNVGNVYGSYNEVDVEGSNSNSISTGTLYGARYRIDHNDDSVSTSTGYLMYLDYDGAANITNPWGLYVTGETKNYLSGTVSIGTTSNSAKLHVNTSGDTDAFRVDVDSSDDPDSSPFVIAEDGRVGIGTASPRSDMALTLNGDGTSYEGISFDVGGSQKWKMSTDSTSMYVDAAANSMDWTFRIRDGSGTLRPQLRLDGGAQAIIIGDDGDGDSDPGAAMNRLQVNVGTNSGVEDGNDGILIVNNDESISATDMIGGIGFDTRDGNVPSSTKEASAYMIAYASEDQGDDDKGGDLAFGVSALNEDDDTVSTEMMRITSRGGIGIGTALPDAEVFHVVKKSRLKRAVVNELSSNTSISGNQMGGSIIHCTGECTLSLQASPEEGEQYVFFNSSSDTVTIEANGSDTINGSTSDITLGRNKGTTVVALSTSAWIAIGGQEQ